MLRYYVTDRHQGDVIVSASHAVRAGVDMIQVREKDLAARELLALVCALRDVAAGTSTRLLVNDRLDIALAAGIDGVHLPANGLPAAKVRPFVKSLGISVHRLEEAVAAERAGADFIVFGPIFDTPGKTAVGLEPLREVAATLRIPVLGIGGITTERIGGVLSAGAAGVAGIRLFQISSRIN
jgi:thiamine-phosphate pyrophosphorylase